MPLLASKCSTILMPIKINFNQGGAGVSLSPGVGLPTMMWTHQTAKIAYKPQNYPHLYSELPLLASKLCSTILMPIKINFNQGGAGVSLSPRVGLPTMMWYPQTAKIA